VHGLSDNITVRSIVGRFLEHSRIFRFGTAGPDVAALVATPARFESGEKRPPEEPSPPGRRDTTAITGQRAPSVPPPDVRGGADVRPSSASYFIGSADLMERNLDRRIEAIVPVRDLELCARLEEAIALDLADDTHAWNLAGDGSWRKVPTEHGVSAQAELEMLAVERSRRRHSLDGLSPRPD
jgi:polyphosphate kinase